MNEQIKIGTLFQMPVLQYLYQFKGDNQFHQIPDDILNIKGEDERIIQLLDLEANKLVLFETKPEKPKPFAFIFGDFETQVFRENMLPIKGMITQHGILAVEKFNSQQK